MSATGPDNNNNNSNNSDNSSNNSNNSNNANIPVWRLEAQRAAGLAPSSPDDYFYLPIALGCMGLGGLLGGFLTMRKNKGKINAKRLGAPVKMAFKALGIATAITLGAFGIGAAAFVKLTDVRTFAELDAWGKYQFNKFETIVENRGKHRVDEALLREAGAKDEEEYLRRVFEGFVPGQGQGNSSSDSNNNNSSSDSNNNNSSSDSSSSSSSSSNSSNSSNSNSNSSNSNSNSSNSDSSSSDSCSK